MVTARRVGERLRDVPVSITAIAPDASLNGTLDAATEVSRRAPNVSITDAGQGRRVALVRGIGLLGLPISPFDTTIGIALDGMPLSSDVGFSQTLDVTRVEMLRGPQNVLFGRSSQAGTINLVTRQADGTSELNASFEVGDTGLRTVEATAGASLIDGILAGRVAVRSARTRGSLRNLGTGSALGANEVTAGRASLRLTPASGLRMRLSLYREETTGNPSSYVVKETKDKALNWLDVDPFESRRVTTGALELVQETPGFEIAASAGLQAIDLHGDLELTDALLYARIFGRPPQEFTNSAATDFSAVRSRERAQSAEVRLSSNPGGRVRWIGGLSAYASRYAYGNRQTNSISPASNADVTARIATRSLSIFGEVGIPLSRTTALTLGARAGRDLTTFRSQFDSLGTPGVIPAFNEAARVKEAWASGGVTFEWRPGGNRMAWISFKTGRSPAGFASYNPNAGKGVSQAPYRRSMSLAHEIGGRHALLDGKLDVSVSAFYNDVRSGHLQALDFVNSRTIVEALDYRTYGIELEGRLDTGAGFDIVANGGLTSTSIGEVPTGSVTGARRGNRVPGVAGATGFVGVGRKVAFIDGMLDTQVDIQFVSARAADLSNAFDLAGHASINARVAWKKGRLSAHLFARNLLDRRAETLGTQFLSVAAVFLGPRRTVGIGLSWQLGT